MIVKIKFFSDKAVMPAKAHDDDFAYDVVATSCEEIAPNVYKYGLGFGLQIEEMKYVSPTVGISLRPRSSVWKTGMVLSNCIGTIDVGYTGEISAVFYHVMPDMPRYQVGDRIGQIHFDGTARMEFQRVSEFEETERGAGGYGSSGK